MDETSNFQASIALNVSQRRRKRPCVRLCLRFYFVIDIFVQKDIDIIFKPQVSINIL